MQNCKTNSEEPACYLCPDEHRTNIKGCPAYKKFQKPKPPRKHTNSIGDPNADVKWAQWTLSHRKAKLWYLKRYQIIAKKDTINNQLCVCVCVCVCVYARARLLELSAFEPCFTSGRCESVINFLSHHHLGRPHKDTGYVYLWKWEYVDDECGCSIVVYSNAFEARKGEGKICRRH